MILPEVIQRKSLFSLLYQIDQKLCEQVRVRGCPIAGDRFIAPTTSESLAVVPVIFARLGRLGSVFAAAGQDAGIEYCHHRCGFGAAGFTGRR